MSVCRSVGWSVGRSVGRSVDRLVRLLGILYELSVAMRRMMCGDVADILPTELQIVIRRRRRGRK